MKKGQRVKILVNDDVAMELERVPRFKIGTLATIHYMYADSAEFPVNVKLDYGAAINFAKESLEVIDEPIDYSNLIGKYVTASVKGEPQARQGFVLSVNPIMIVSASTPDIQWECEDRVTIVTNPPCLPNSFTQTAKMLIHDPDPRHRWRKHDIGRIVTDTHTLGRNPIAMQFPNGRTLYFGEKEIHRLPIEIEEEDENPGIEHGNL